MDEKKIEKEKSIDRRDLIKKAAYIAPAILTLIAVPAIAQNGSPQPLPPAKQDPIYRRW